MCKLGRHRIIKGSGGLRLLVSAFLSILVVLIGIGSPAVAAVGTAADSPTVSATLLRNTETYGRSPLSPDPSGLTYALSSVDAADMNLFTAARGVGDDSDLGENDGVMYEITFPPLKPEAAPTPSSTETPTFTDVPLDHPYHDEIEWLYQKGYVEGCSADPLMYCPDDVMTRAESSVFVERGFHGVAVDPTMPGLQVFDDVSLDKWFARWVTALWDDGFTAGCGVDPLVYCPWQGHTRVEGAVFFLRMLHGIDYQPPDPQGIFVDAPIDYWGAKWAEEAYHAGLIPACGGVPLRYCPEDSLSRGLAAYMMARAKGMPSPCDNGSCPIVPVRIEFTPSNEDFANPERGFMKQSSVWPDQAFSSSKVDRKEPSDSVVWIYFRLDNYRDPRDGVGVKLNDYQCQPIDPTGLSRIEQTFQTAREKGLKLVYRFIYNWGPSWTSDPNKANPDAPIECVRGHLEQLRPILSANADVTAAAQVGFVGHWGEWHSSKYLHPLEIRREIVDTLLDILPKDRMLQIRYPRYKELFFGGVLSEAEAFSQSPQSRVGHHNDCFLEGDDDTTYRSTSVQEPKYHSTFCDGQDQIACWKDYVAQEGRFTPIGGETCAYNPPRTDCANAVAEMEMLHWSFINNDYYPSVLDGWVNGGCMGTIRRRLGYRLVLNEAVVPQALRPGSAFDLEVSLRNDGFAAMFNPRPLFVVLDGPGGRYGAQLQAVDPRRWESGTSRTVAARLRLPVGLAEGTYRLSLWLPDQASSLRNDPRYAVRFANTQVWDASTGLNVLTTNFKVAAGAPGFDDLTALELHELGK